jgi:ergothioneine biosynthesis protein EgtB
MTTAKGHQLSSTSWPERYCSVRSVTEAIAEPLSAEDQTAQSMPDVSPTKWHRAHVTWFFEEFVLAPSLEGYRRFHPGFGYLFNSYYEAVGPRHPRPERGVITRPGAAEVTEYRGHVDAAMVRLLEDGPDPGLLGLIELGLHHEQQHQELALMDIKHVLSGNVLDPVYRPTVPPFGPGGPLTWVEHPGGVTEVGAHGTAFSFDNERPRHRVHLEPFALASRPITAAEVMEFIHAGGYERADLWLSDGWAAVQAGSWEAPLYWRREGGADWSIFTLGGRRELDPDEPACHLSYYEADAIARSAGARLPTEAEWEAVAATDHGPEGGLLDFGVLHPRPAPAPAPAPPSGRASQLIGDVWEWTASAYLPYPGYRAAPGAVGEYNGKFMVNQHVLRGGSCLTPAGHVRTTYRNFFPPSARWAMAGARLARDLED